MNWLGNVDWGLGKEGRTHGKEVYGAHHYDDNPRSDHNPPECETETLLACCRLVEIAQNAITDKEHCAAEHYEAGFVTEERPVSGEVGLEEREFSDYEKAWIYEREPCYR